jgi:oligopeptidase B
MKRLCLLLLIGYTATASAVDPSVATPPTAKVIPHTTDLHGQKLKDDYFWLKDKKNPETIKYLEAENAYTAAVTKPLEGFRKKLYDEMLSRIKQTDLSVPNKDGQYWYYTRTEEGKQYTIFCRKKESLKGKEEVILDVNELAKGQKFMSASPADYSDDGRYMAFITDTTGFREYMLSVKDLETGKLLEDKFVKSNDVTFAADGKTLFYTTEDDAKRAHKLWRHTIGQPKEKDVLVYEEKDELFRLGAGRSRDKKFLYHVSASSTTSEQRYLPSDTPAGEWKMILPREEGHEYGAEHRDGLFYIRTNKGEARNFKLVTAAVGKHTPADWKEFLPYNADIMISGLTLFKNFAVVSERQGGLPHVRVVDLKTSKQHRIEWPEPVYTAGLSGSEYDSETTHLSYTSMVTPSSVYDYNLATKERKLLKRTEVPNYNPEDYVSERIEATSHDGVKVPISIVYKKGLKKDGTAPVLLYGYGSYGMTMPVGFSATRLPLLDRGVVYALGHIRGGSDMGRQWYDDGKMMKKKNTFLDFIACADHLVKEKYGSRDRLGIMGGSAGGLLVGATINFRPDVCKVAVLQVPFVDVINTMLDETLPLTVQEFLEWGNPKKSEEYEYMKSYCPYTNLAKKAYPSILVTTSLNDSQVLFHEPTKYVAKIRTLKTDKNPLIFRCNMDAGHGGASGRYDALKEQALDYSFVLDQMGIKE